MKKQQQIRREYKDVIIYNALLYLFTGDCKYREAATIELSFFAAYYHIILPRKKHQYDLRIAIDDFMINKKGYNTTVLTLYNSLI